MTRPLPTERQLSDMLDALLALTRKVGKKGDQQFAVEQLVLRVRRAYERDRTGSAIPDGFPRGSGGGGGSPGLPRRTVDEDEHGPQESVEFTSVELAHIDREENARSARDHHHELVTEVLADLDLVVSRLALVAGKLDRIDNLIDTNPDAATAVEKCRSHARIKDGLGREYFEPLDRAAGARDGLCRWCWGFVHDTEKNPERELPPVRLLERLIVQGKVTTKDLIETRKVG